MLDTIVIIERDIEKIPNSFNCNIFAEININKKDINAPATLATEIEKVCLKKIFFKIMNNPKVS